MIVLWDYCCDSSYADEKIGLESLSNLAKFTGLPGARTRSETSFTSSLAVASWQSVMEEHTLLPAAMQLSCCVRRRAGGQGVVGAFYGYNFTWHLLEQVINSTIFDLCFVWRQDQSLEFLSHHCCLLLILNMFKNSVKLLWILSPSRYMGHIVRGTWQEKSMRL